MKKLLLNDKGGGYITACVIILVIAMILSAVLFYAQCMTILQTTRDNTELVLESFIIQNSILIYDSIKQGHDLTEYFDENDYISEISSRFSLDIQGGALYSYGEEGELIYAMTNPYVTYKVDKALKLKASYTVMIPVTFAGKRLFFLRVPMTVTRSLTLKA
jgi:hypothetical protein